MFKIFLDHWSNGSRPFFECECGNHAFTALSGTGVALVDVADVNLVNDNNWSATSIKNGQRRVSYAVATVRQSRRKQRLMHRIIMGDPLAKYIDHINHNGLDNRRNNLRPVTAVQNLANRRPQLNSSSRYKGVAMTKSGKWSASIKVNGKARAIGVFESEEDAALAYNLEAYFAWGDYAYMNTYIENRI